jgi:hypothetical protein
VRAGARAQGLTPEMRTVVGLISGALLSAAACALDHEPTGAGEDEGVDAAARANVDATPADAAATVTGAPLTVLLGTGSASFVALHDGDAVTMVRGKQGFQHVWVSARVAEPNLRDVVVTISTHLVDGRPGGPSLTAAITLDAIDGGAGAGEEKVGLTGLVDYVVIGKSVRVRLEVKTPDGSRVGSDERTIDVLAPINYACTTDAGATSCEALCAHSTCSACETGSAAVGFVDSPDGSAPIASCTEPLDRARLAGASACCCCR